MIPTRTELSELRRAKADFDEAADKLEESQQELIHSLNLVVANMRNVTGLIEDIGPAAHDWRMEREEARRMEARRE